MRKNSSRPILCASALAMAIAAASTAAHAQTLDYGTMQDIFGEPVTEGATGTPKRASDVPVDMTIITADEIRRSGARDLPEILRRVPGLDVQRLTQTSASVSVRGLNNDGGRVRVLINGRDTFRTYEGTTSWASLPVSLEEIRQVEVVRGPATALYGANAVTGVINIVTFSPLYDDANTATARIGDQGLREVSGVATLHLGDKAGVRVSGGYMESHIFNAPMEEGEALARVKPEGAHFIVDGLAQVTDSVQAGAEVTYFDGDVATTTAAGNLNNSGDTIFSVRGTLAAETGFGRWTLQAFLNDNKEARNTIVTIDGDIISVTQDIAATTKSVELSNIQTVGSNTGLRVSVGYRDDAVGQFGGSAADGTGDVGYRTLYASMLIDQPLTDTLTLDVSARYDSINTRRTADELPTLAFTNADFGSYDAISANVGLTYKPSAFDTVKLMYARGFWAPSLFDLGGQVIPTGNTFPGAVATGGVPFIDPSISTQLEAQYRHNIEAIHGAASVAVFYRADNDVFRNNVLGGLYPAVGGGYYIGAATLGDVETWGIELDVTGKAASAITWGLHYGLAKSTDDLATDAGVTLAADVYPFVTEFFEKRGSEHIATANLGYEKETGVYGEVLVQYKSGYDSYENFVYIPGMVDPYRTVGDVVIGNAHVGYKLENGLRVFGTVEGAFNSHRQEGAPTQARLDRRAWLGAALDF